MLNIDPREYQKEIFEVAKEKNTLVVLPTGLGKTLIALMLAMDRLKKYPLNKILILAPTKPIVEQHFGYFKKNMPELFADLQIFTGAVAANKRQEIWDTAEIIFSTPQCIANDVSRGLYSLKEASLLVIDEAHRCLKNYDYTKVVRFYKSQSDNIRILGLTASPGSEFDKVKEICSHLDIEEVQIRDRESPDVKKYLQEAEFTKVEVELPSTFLEIRALLKKLYDSKINSLKNTGLVYGPINKITLLTLQRRLFGQTNNGGVVFAAISLCAQAIKLSHALDLLETQTLSGLKSYLDDLIKQSETKKSRGVQTIVNSLEFKKALVLVNGLMSQEIEHPKIEKIREYIESQVNENEGAKIMLFTQFRETALVLSRRLNKNPKITSKIFVGQAKKKNSQEDTGLSQREQKEIIEDFKEGKINVLCATSIGEEGLDIPEVQAVIFYETVASPIRKIQRAGRTARLAPGKILIFITKDTKDQTYHYASAAKEKKMYKTIEKVKDSLKRKTLFDYK